MHVQSVIGGANLMFGPEMTILLGAAKILSPDGKSQMWDEKVSACTRLHCRLRYLGNLNNLRRPMVFREVRVLELRYSSLLPTLFETAITCELSS